MRHEEECGIRIADMKDHNELNLQNVKILRSEVARINQRKDKVSKYVFCMKGGTLWRF